MAGLSVVLEPPKKEKEKEKRTTNRLNDKPQVINKASLMSPKPCPSPTLFSSPSSSSWKSKNNNNNTASSSLPAVTATGFLNECFLCKHKLSPAKDIYMYK